ncbi:hypothetical protein AVEN_149055-1 [Araneus ventricosus]|uniref:Uncharacterized protein n=1 Tax=Araneus ventricosus TaxID=182803 RepID=A0A4Y2LNS1_ARAVE|nr:hypothetical protein AVEN_149055-1 [Araneus ventricosus]
MDRAATPDIEAWCLVMGVNGKEVISRLCDQVELDEGSSMLDGINKDSRRKPIQTTNRRSQSLDARACRSVKCLLGST